MVQLSCHNIGNTQAPKSTVKNSAEDLHVAFPLGLKLYTQDD